MASLVVVVRVDWKRGEMTMLMEGQVFVGQGREYLSKGEERERKEIGCE